MFVLEKRISKRADGYWIEVLKIRPYETKVGDDPLRQKTVHASRVVYEKGPYRRRKDAVTDAAR